MVAMRVRRGSFWRRAEEMVRVASAEREDTSAPVMAVVFLIEIFCGQFCVLRCVSSLEGSRIGYELFELENYSGARPRALLIFPANLDMSLQRFDR